MRGSRRRHAGQRRAREAQYKGPGGGPGTSGGTDFSSEQGSNAARLEALGLQGPQGPSNPDINAAFGFVLSGDFKSAKASAQKAADAARAGGQDPIVQQAGLVWRVATAFEQTTAAMADKRYDAAKNHAAEAGSGARALLALGGLDATDVDRSIQSAGQAWTLAKQAADKAAAEQTGREVPIVDQHQLSHDRNWAFCGVATLIMMLRANGIKQGSSTGELNGLADRVYHTGKGTSGADMAGVLRERGLKDSTYTTTGGTGALLQSLDKGQPVPFGVMSVQGVVTKLEGGSSHRYSGRRVGDSHTRQFQGSGHWVLVVRYEGKQDAPTAFYVNDPDLGGELRCTPAQLDDMGMGNGNYWMVHQ